MSGKCQGNTKFSSGSLKSLLKKLLASNNFEKMSGYFGHITHVRELPGNFVMSHQGIVREFYHGIIFRLKLPSYKGSTWACVYVNVCLAK